MSNPDTWMPLYVSRYLGDTGHLTVAEHGAYLLLLMQYWVRGPLPDDDQELAIMARTDIKAWRKGVGKKVRQFFTVRDGALHQKRADAELAKADQIIQKKRNAANTRWSSEKEPPPEGRGGQKSGEGAHAPAMHVHNTSIADGEHPQSTSDPDAMRMQCPLPVPVPSKNLTFLDSGSKPRAGTPAREAATPPPRETRATPPPTPEEIAAVDATVANLTASLTMRKSAPGKWQRLSEAEQRAVAAAVVAQKPPTKPLTPEQLAIRRRQAGIGPAAPEQPQLRVVT